MVASKLNYSFKQTRILRAAYLKRSAARSGTTIVQSAIEQETS